MPQNDLAEGGANYAQVARDDAPARKGDGWKAL